MATEDAARAMNLFYEELNALYSDIAKRSGLSGSAFDILYALHEEDGRRMVDLCRASFMSKQTLASSVRRLEEQGLVRTEARSGGGGHRAHRAGRNARPRAPQPCRAAGHPGIDSALPRGAARRVRAALSRLRSAMIDKDDICSRI